MNVLKPHLQTTIWTLLSAGAGQREIERVTGIDRKTIRGYQQRFAAEQANSPTLSTGSRADPIGEHGVGLRALSRLHRSAATPAAQRHGQRFSIRRFCLG